MKEEIRQKLTGAVIGLARTCENNEKTENTNRVFLEALTAAGDWSASTFDMSEMLEKVRNEKYTVSPGCEHVQHHVAIRMTMIWRICGKNPKKSEHLRIQS